MPDDYNLNDVWHVCNGAWMQLLWFACSFALSLSLLLSLIILKSFEWSYIVHIVHVACSPAFLFHVQWKHSRRFTSVPTCVCCSLYISGSLHGNRWINSPKAFRVVKEFQNRFVRTVQTHARVYPLVHFPFKSKNILRNVLKIFAYTFSSQVFWYNTRHQTNARRYACLFD